MKRVKISGIPLLSIRSKKMADWVGYNNLMAWLDEYMPLEPATHLQRWHLKDEKEGTFLEFRYDKDFVFFSLASPLTREHKNE